MVCTGMKHLDISTVTPYLFLSVLVFVPVAESSGRKVNLEFCTLLFQNSLNLFKRLHRNIFCSSEISKDKKTVSRILALFMVFSVPALWQKTQATQEKELFSTFYSET